MGPLSRLPFQTKLIALVIGLLITTNVTLSVVIYANYRTSLTETMVDKLATSLRVLGFDTRTNVPEVRYTLDERSTLTDIVFPAAIPAETAQKIAAGVASQTATVIAFLSSNASGGLEVTAIASGEGDDYASPVPDATSPAMTALRAGERFRGLLELGGKQTIAHFEPVRDASGSIAGALYVGHDAKHLNDILDALLVRLGALTIAGVAIAAIVAFLLLRAVLGPLSRTATALETIAGGNLQANVPKIETRDEIGAIAGSVERFRQELIQAEAQRAQVRAAEELAEAQRVEQERVVGDLSSALTRLAEGDLTAVIDSPANDPFPGKYEALRSSYNDAIERFAHTLLRIRSVADGVRSGSVEISDASRDLSSRAESQAATLEQSAAALNELTESVRSTASIATSAQNASEENRGAAERGANVVTDAIEAMRGIENGSAQISRIIGVIDDIAFQTNLLALNAGVEAARAGDAGRGFAVVASEVRLLAQRASESAREIKALIADSAAQVKSGSDLVSRTGKSLEGILQRASEASKLVADIAFAASEQSTGLDEVNIGISQLDVVTQQNAGSADQTTAIAITLQQRAEELMAALGDFRLEAGRGSPSAVPRAAGAGSDWASQARDALFAPPAPVPTARRAVNAGFKSF